MIKQESRGFSGPKIAEQRGLFLWSTSNLAGPMSIDSRKVRSVHAHYFA